MAGAGCLSGVLTNMMPMDMVAGRMVFDNASHFPGEWQNHPADRYNTPMPHDTDASYKLLFSAPEVVRDLVLGFIPDDWLHSLDYTTQEKIPGSL
jgi:hypothetical protein